MSDRNTTSRNGRQGRGARRKKHATLPAAPVVAETGTTSPPTLASAVASGTAIEVAATKPWPADPATSPYPADPTKVVRYFDYVAGELIESSSREKLEGVRVGAQLKSDQLATQLAAVATSLDEEDIIILRTLAKYTNRRLKQELIESLSDWNVSLRTIKTRVPILEAEGLVTRPRNLKQGYVITAMGCEILKAAQAAPF
jgi:hypothetical protein